MKKYHENKNQSFQSNPSNDRCEQQSDEEDDLALFQEQKRLKIMKQSKIPSLNLEQQQENSKTNDLRFQRSIGEDGNIKKGLQMIQSQQQSGNSKQQKNQGFNENQESSMQQEFNKFYGNKSKQIQNQIFKHQKQPARQINEQQLSAKKLRQFNAAKYFQKIKLAFLKQIHNQINQILISNAMHNQSMHQNYKGGDQRGGDSKWAQFNFNIFLSCLPYDIIQKFYQIRTKNPFAINHRQVLNLLKQTFVSKHFNSYQKCMQEQLKYNEQLEYNDLFANNLPQVLNKGQLIIQFSRFLKCKIKKISYFNIQNFVDQPFYNLDFQKTNKKNKKGKTKLQEQIKNKIQRHVYQQQLEQNQQCIDLNNFSFDNVWKNRQKTQQQLNNQLRNTKKRSKKILQIKKQFEQQTYQIFSCQQNKWKLFIAIQDHFEQVQIEWFKQNILNGLPIVGFYSLEALQPLKQYQELLDLRKMKNIEIKDISMYFCDNWKKLVNRKKRVGIRPLMGKLFRFCKFKKPFDILQKHDSYQLQQTAIQIKQIIVSTQMPKSNFEFNFSEYFTTPSRVGKYHVLSPQSTPISGIEDYNEEKIYWKDDLIPVCSRMGWIDFSRMVIEGQQTLKKTQNRNKKVIQLFRYQQTKPFILQFDQQGNFVLDPEHNSIYVPPNLQIPDQTCIITEKISFVCNKHKLKFAKLVQGFIHTGGMRVLPNEIGFLIYKKDKQTILKLFEERQEILNRNKQQRYDEKIQKMWKQLLKYVKLIQRMGGAFRP